MAESFIDRLLREQREASGFGAITKPSAKIATAPAALAPALQGYSGVPHAPTMAEAERADLEKGVTVEPQKIDKAIPYQELSTRLMKLSDTPSASDLARAYRAPAAPAVAEGPKVDGASPAPTPAVAAVGPAKMPEATIEPVAPAPVEVGPVQPEISTARAPQGFDWNKVGEIAKSTGRSVLDILQAAIAGRTAGLAGRAFNPATDTMAGIRKGKEQDVANQKELMGKQFEFSKQLRELDQDFQSKQDNISRAFDLQKDAADKKFAVDRDTVAYQRSLQEAEAERQQRMKELQFQAKSAVDLEKLRQGIPTAGGLPASDVASLNSFLPKTGAKK